MAEDSGIKLPKTKHKNLETGEYDYYEEIEPRSIARAIKRDENIITTVAYEENELRPTTTRVRLKFCDRFLGVKVDQSDGERRHLKDWRDVVFVDEFYKGIGPQETFRIKCREGLRYEKKNIQWKAWTTKDDR